MKPQEKILLIDSIRRYKTTFVQPEYFTSCGNFDVYELEQQTSEGKILIQFQFRDARTYENIKNRLHIRCVKSSVLVRMWKDGKIFYNTDTVGKYSGLDAAIKFIRTL